MLLPMLPQRPPRVAELHAAFLTLLLALPGALAAQSIIAITPQQCVWRAGDDPAWAAPTLDETGWQPYSKWKSNANEAHIWVRCHANLTSLVAIAHPAIQVTFYAAYQLFLDGTAIGGAGDLRSGNFSVDAIRTYPIAAAISSTSPSTLALRITRRSLSSNSSPILGSLALRLELRAGDISMLDALRARFVLAQTSRYFKTAICYGIIGVTAVMLLGLYFYDRSHRELILLSVACLGAAILRLNEFFVASQLDYSFTVCLTLVLVGNVCITYTQFPFFFALARRRMPMFYRIVLAIAALPYLPTVADILLASRQPVWLGTLNTLYGRPCALITHIALATAPFIAFWPYKKVARRMRPLAALCIMWGLVDLTWFALEATEYPIAAVPNLFAQWGPALIESRAFSTAAVLAALLGLLFREQRQITEERALLAGEMQAASEIQRMLAPAKIDTAPGLKIDVAFHPMREVGGDFYSCRILPGNRQRILVGDVSGKGAAAAMTAAVLVGAAQRNDAHSPVALLRHLNLVMKDMRLGGFATCLCAELAADGVLTVANAGHLAPYRNGHEVTIENGLPLGISSEAEYSETSFQLAPGDSLTFISDGIVEARNAAGELFGFDRTAAIAHEPAGAIASAAQRFGQEDDITVLTLTRLAADRESTFSTAIPATEPA